MFCPRQFWFCWLGLALVTGRGAEPAPITTTQADMAGEVTQTSVILQSRLTAANALVAGDLPGAEGLARFEIATKSDFRTISPTPWLSARPDNDFIVKTTVSQLRPNTLYYYRVAYGHDTNSTRTGPTSQFKTLPPEDSTGDVTFTVGQAMNYSFFHYGSDGRGKLAYQGPDRGLGYPALEQIMDLRPDFMVFAGNSVYYDYPTATRAKSQPLMRQRWHEQFIQPRLIKLLAQIPAYWQKNDHDYRFDDADTSGERAPVAQVGAGTFLEQVPLLDPAGTNSLTYRSHRINRHLEIWLLEVRDFRSSNNVPDGLDKTLWGVEQREWLKKSLSLSDATFKLVISPTPLIDPDDPKKIDNHTNPGGFKQEGDAFFRWLQSRHFSTNQVVFIAGDRHWQYHTAHASGFMEFGCGNLANGNTRGIKPPAEGDDNDGVHRLFVQRQEGGGYLQIGVRQTGGNAVVRFGLRDEKGIEVYAHEKMERLK